MHTRWDLICDCLFGLDIAKQFNTAFEADGFVHWDRSEVTSRYLKGWFIIDLVSTFPFQVCLCLPSTVLLLLLLLLFLLLLSVSPSKLINTCP